MAEFDDLSTGQIAEKIRDAPKADWAYLLRVLQMRPDADPYLANLIGQPERDLQRMAIQMTSSPIGEETVKALAELLEDPDPRLRRVVAERLGESASSSALRPLTRQLNDPDLAVRKAVIYSLGKFGDSSVLSSVTHLLDDRNEELRYVALEMLSRLRKPELVSRVSALIEDPSPRVRMLAVETLGHFETPDALNALQVASWSREEQVRVKAAQALGEISGPRVLSLLNELIDLDSSPDVREAAAASRERIEARETLGESPRPDWLYREWFENPTLNPGSQIYRFEHDQTGLVEEFHMGLVRDQAHFRYKVDGDILSFKFGSTNDWVQAHFTLQHSRYQHPVNGEVPSLKLIFAEEPYFREFGSLKERVYYSLI